MILCVMPTLLLTGVMKNKPLYKAASSGLVEDINNLEYEINHIDYPKDKAKLMEWWKAKKVKLTSVLIINNFYIALPWG